MNPDKAIHRIQSIEVSFPMPSDGIPVDKMTGLPSSEDANVTPDEPIILVQLRGEEFKRGITGSLAMEIHSALWKYFSSADE